MKIKKINLINFGSIITHHEDRESNEKSVSGYFLYTNAVNFIDQTDVLKGTIGLKFGIEYFIQGYTPEKFKDVNFRCIITHPPLTNPETGFSSSRTIETKNNYLNENNFDYFHFEYHWEISQGIWTFQIIENDVIKLEKRFEII